MREANTILLTTEQETLLRWIVSRWKELPAGKRNFIAAVNPAGGDFIEMGGERLTIDYSDLEELHDKRLVRYTERPQMHAGDRPVAERGAVTAEGLTYVDASAIAAPPREPDILLTDDQRDLLILLVEDTRRTPKESRDEYLATGVGGGVIIGRPDRYSVFMPDLYELGHKGLLRLRETSKGNALFVVSPEGFVYYDQVKRFQGEALQRVEAETRYLLDRVPLEPFGEAVTKWREAEDLLWRTDAEEQLTTIGHKCREALQSFAQGLYEKHCPASDPMPKEKTLNKMRAVLATCKESVGETTEAFLNAYWATVNDLAERAAHDSQREERPLLWDDGRRLVFQTLSVFAEVAAAVGS